MTNSYSIMCRVQRTATAAVYARFLCAPILIYINFAFNALLFFLCVSWVSHTISDKGAIGGAAALGFDSYFGFQMLAVGFIIASIWWSTTTSRLHFCRYVVSLFFSLKIQKCTLSEMINYTRELFISDCGAHWLRFGICRGNAIESILHLSVYNADDDNVVSIWGDIVANNYYLWIFDHIC